MALNLALALLRPHPHNPRTNPDPEYIQELQQSLAEQGQWESILVRPLGEGTYQIISGHCRVAAAKALGWKQIRAEVRQLTDEEADFLVLDTNLKRRNLSELEEADGIRHMMQAHGWTQTNVAQQFGKTQAWVSYRLSLLGLAPEVKAKVITQVINPTQAREIAKAPLEVQPAIAAKVEQAGLSKDATQQLVKVVTAPEVPADVKRAALTEPAVTPAHAEALARLPEPSRRELYLDGIRAGEVTLERVQQEAERVQRARQQAAEPPSLDGHQAAKRHALMPPLVRAETALGELEDMDMTDQPDENLRDALRAVGGLKTSLAALRRNIETEITRRQARQSTPPAGKVVALRKAH